MDIELQKRKLSRKIQKISTFSTVCDVTLTTCHFFEYKIITFTLQLTSKSTGSKVGKTTILTKFKMDFVLIRCLYHSYHSVVIFNSIQRVFFVWDSHTHTHFTYTKAITFISFLNFIYFSFFHLNWFGLKNRRLKFIYVYIQL